MKVKSVYNFVPAPKEKEDEVFTPEWAEQVSHDIPFSDGESGEIELTITAKTPIFIRNGHTKADKELHDKKKEGNLPNPTKEQQEAINRYLEFSNVERNDKKQYFIPATSVKGMIRNVLEIMSFSRMKQVGDDRYSFRDLSKSGNLYLSKYKEFGIQGGWLIQDFEGNWKIEECDDLAFIHHKELQKKDIPFRELFLNKQPIEKTAKYKYKIVDKSKLNGKFKTYTKELFGNVKRTMANYDETGKEGTLVFTGQSSKRNEYKNEKGELKASGKIHEFVFFSSNKPNYLDVDDKMQKDFKFIYLDHDRQNISKDWKSWRTKLEKGEKIPVFFAKSNNKVKHFGLAYMYKLPYEYSVKKLQDYDNKNGVDLAELIFGSVEDKENALKGRVFISHAFAEKTQEMKEEKEILASPKASYFPYYLEQPKDKKNDFYYTYMDSDATLRGYKRYPVQDKENLFKPHYDEKQKRNKKVFTFYKPLDTEAEFKCKIRFHNLRKVEIGALLSAITFHGTEKKSLHSIGGAKPFGNGKVQVSDINLKFLDETADDYLIHFEEAMQKDKKGSWLKSNQIQELFAMAQHHNDDLEYPDKPTTFVNYKNQNLYLPKHSETIGNKKIQIQSISEKKKIIDDFGSQQFDTSSFKKFKKEINKLGLIPLPDNMHQSIKEKIKIIYEKHRESKRTLSKKSFADQYEWHTTISNWFGKPNAFDFYRKLTGKEE